MADDPQPTEPPSEMPNEAGAERKPLLKRAAGAWKRRSPAWKAGVIGVAAAAAAAGAVAYARRANAANDDGERQTGDETPKPTGILADVARILEEAAAAARDEIEGTSGPLSTEGEEEPDGSDGASGPARPRRGGPVGGHWRDHCRNSRRHASGGCTHETIWIDDYEKPGREEETAEA
ncbi:hypothetical protein [Streptomyces sp. NPDC127092]|uniref:hypothetical protein n=1 Tax=Streptomyces sp. NPDC127092 TaxID=3347135 RepID=UPI003665FE99